jgi:5-methylcytosine-specific restriction protein A
MPLRRCLEPGCGEYVRDGSRCKADTKTKWKTKAGTSMGPGWSARRVRILKRDGYRCVLCGSRWMVSVDHIVPRSQGGGDEDSNLRVLCRVHHTAKTQAEALEGRKRANLA